MVGIGAALGALALELEQKKKKRARKVRSGNKTSFFWEMKDILHREVASADAVAIR